MKSWSLRWRISALVGAVLVTVVVTFSIAAYDELGDALRASLDVQLLTTAQGLAAELAEQQTPEELGRESRATAGNSNLVRPTIYRVWLAGNDQDTLASDPATSDRGRLARSLPSEPPTTGKWRSFDTSLQGRPWRGAWLRVATAKGDTHVVVLRSSHHVYREMHEFLRLLLILGSATMVAALLLCALIVRVAVRPIGRASARLDEVSYDTLGRADLSGLALPNEIEPFLRAVVELLGRLDQATQKQKQFAADASHELRTPLTTAKSSLQLVRLRDRDGADYRRTIDEALDDLTRMEKLIGQLLLLARMDAGAAEGNVQTFALGDLAAGVAGQWQDRAAQAGGHIVCEANGDLHVRGDADQLRRMLANVISNAVEHGPAGGTVTVTLGTVAEESCEIVVHDEGGAIPPEAVERLFDRFYRVDSSRTSETGGTGLGLAIARQIARHHGGDIRIESSPEAGTTLFIRLPRA